MRLREQLAQQQQARDNAQQQLAELQANCASWRPNCARQTP
jgi:hypothetical protein